MKTGVGALEQFPEGHDVRVGSELAAQASGGSADSLEVLARFDEGAPAAGETKRRTPPRSTTSHAASRPTRR